MQMLKQKPKQKKQGKPIPWRPLFACIIILLLIIAGTLWGLSSEKIIQGDWSTILQIVLTIAALIVAVVQWLFPFEPKTSTDSTPPPPSPINPTPQPQPSITSNPNNPTPITTQTIPDQIFYFNQQLPKANEFYGRARERETLLSRTRNGASTSIVGPRRIGKTWLIDYLKLVAPTELDPNMRLVYLDATAPNCTTLSGFISEALQGLGTPIIDRTSLTLNNLENVVKNLKVTNQSPILCIDEFEGLCKQPGFSLAMLENLRAIANHGLGMVVVSKQPISEIVANILGEPGKTSPFFNIFQQITLKPFTKLEAEEFAQAKSTQAGFTDEERAFLLQYGQEKKQWPPLLLQLVGEMLLSDKNLAAKGSPHYYRPNDADYRQDFKQRLLETYRGVVP